MKHYDELMKVLEKAQEQRPNLRKWVNNELEWVSYERQQMLNAVNTLCGQKATFEEIIKIENSALGHSDYSSKFVLRCCELISKKSLE